MSSQQTSSSENTIHIKNLHPSITDEMLWQAYKDIGGIQSIKISRDRVTQKSKCYGRVTFQSSEYAKEAMNRTNFTHLLPNTIPKQKLILVTKNTSNYKEGLQKNNIFITGLPTDKSFYNGDQMTEFHPQKLYQDMTQLGEIVSLNPSFNLEKNIYNGHGYIMFEKQEDGEKALKEGVFKWQGYDLKFEQYKLSGERQSQETQNYYLTDFFPALTEAQVKSFKQEEHKEKLEKLINTNFGQVKSCIVGLGTKQDNNNKIWSFVCFENQQGAQKLEQALQDKDELVKMGFTKEFNALRQQTASRNQQQKSNILGNKLLIRNIKIVEEDKKNEFFQEIRNVLGQYGTVTYFEEKLSQKPTDTQNKGLQDAYSILFDFKNDKESEEFIIKYDQDQNFRNFFIKNKIYGSVTIRLPKEERAKMKKSKKILTAQQQQSSAQQMMLNQQQMMPMMMQQQFIQQQMMNNNRGQNFYQNTRRSQPQYKSFQRQHQNQLQQQQPRGVPQQPNSSNPRQVGKLPQTGAAQQQQSQQQQIQGNLQFIKQNLDQFIKQDSKTQSQTLGNLLFPKVQQLCTQLNYDTSLAPKITGMLIDFQVFEVQDILSTLENDTELKEKVEEAHDLIANQQQQPQQ